MCKLVLDVEDDVLHRCANLLLDVEGVLCRCANLLDVEDHVLHRCANLIYM